jgi:hypothetical protein
MSKNWTTKLNPTRRKTNLSKKRTSSWPKSSMKLKAISKFCKTS